MKKITKITSALCAAAVTAALTFTSFAEPAADQPQMAPETILFEGTVSSVEDGRLVMNRVDRENNFSEEVIVNIPEDMKLLDAVNGYPISLDSLEQGEPIHVYVGPAMTMSLPPMVNGVVVLADIPEDAAFPSYTSIESFGASQNAGEESYVLSASDGKTYVVDGSTILLPYLTRNMVSYENLIPGADILIWSDGSHASKIVIFPGENGYGAESLEKHGWSETESGWYFYEQGELKKGWLYENGDWYYLNPETGLMQTGFLTLGGKTYFLKEDGRMLNEAHMFVPDENGELHFGQ